MLKTQSIILGITTVTAALLLIVIPSQNSFAIGVRPHPLKPKMPISSPGLPKPPNNGLIKKGTAAEDSVRHGTTHGDGHFHPSHSKKCKDMYGNLKPCPTGPLTPADLSR
jgi:hypothetical protein